MLKRFLVNQPVVVGNIVKALVLAAGGALGWAITDNQAAQVTSTILTILALAGVTAAEQASVSPVKKTAHLLEQPVEAVNDLLRGVKL